MLLGCMPTVTPPMWTTLATCLLYTSPQHLFDDVTNALGPIPPTSLVCVPDPDLTTKCMLASWEESSRWQSAALHLLIAQEQYDVVFSHFHNVDLEEHTFIRHMKKKYDTKLPEETYFQFMEDVYKQTDRYPVSYTHLAAQVSAFCPVRVISRDFFEVLQKNL